MFAVGDLKDNTAPMLQPGHNDDVRSLELSHEDVVMQAPAKRTFQSYCIMEKNERPQGEREKLYTIEEEDLPEITLDFGSPYNKDFKMKEVKVTIEEDLPEITLDFGSPYNKDFKMKVLKGHGHKAHHISPLLDFYCPQKRLLSSHGLGQA